MGKYADALLEEAKSYKDTEWKGTLGTLEVTLSARPITPADMSAIARVHPNFAMSPSLDGMIDLIILKAREPDGSRSFDKGDKVLFSKVDTNKVGEIFRSLFGAQMTEDDEEDFEERVGNLRGTTGA